MQSTTEMTELVRAHRSPPEGMKFFDAVDSVRGDSGLLGYVSVIERAWREMNLAGALCIDNRPILYLKLFEKPASQHERAKLQRLFWNQGVANILVLADPQSIYIYSGLAKPSSEDSDKEDEDALVKTLTYAEYLQGLKSFHHNLATGHFYAENQRHFNPNDSVDAWLLDNLRSLRNALINTSKGDSALEIRHAHAFIGRVLFLCYLLDRGIVSLDEFAQKPTGTMVLASALRTQNHQRRINFLYGLFQDLKEKFNGNMFDQDLEAEMLLIQPSHMEKLTLFLGGNSVRSGQLTLGFWPYNFRMIPVETISAVYQDFLGAEDPKGQEKSGAYYTPRFLAEMVVDLAISAQPEAFRWSFLDPACGSGIFLVILFNRLANHWLNGQPESIDYDAKAVALQKILEHQLRGIDREKTACRIACFSLYLAYLDFFDPPDIRDYVERTGKPLPKLLDYGRSSSEPSPDIPVINMGDSLAGELFADKEFDCIIGNPPWEGRQSKQLAQRFLEKAPQFLRNGGTGCFLLPSKILQNQTNAFQATWLSEVSLRKVIQLADYRFVLFQDALCPAFIALFSKTLPSPAKDTVEFTAPKFNRDGLRKGVITVNPSDRTWIPLSNVLAATRTKTAPLLWKRRLWGTKRDQKLLDLLEALPPLLDQVDIASELRKRRLGRRKRWIAGQGIKPWSEKAKTVPDRELKATMWSPDSRFIETKSWISDLVLLPEDAITLEDRFRKKKYRTDVLYSQPPQDIFHSPMVLVSQGVDKVKVGFCDFDVLFQDSLQSISGQQEDAELLMFLAAYLRSSLAKYFLFHTSANWGIERPKVHLFELLRVPFPLPGDEFIPKDGQSIVSDVAERMSLLYANLERSFKDYDCGRNTIFTHGPPRPSQEWKRERKKQVDTLQEELEPLVYRYFGLTEQEIALIEDTTRVAIPSSTPKWSESTLTLESIEQSSVPPYAEKGLRAYADTLAHTLNSWAETEGSVLRVRAEGGTDNHTGLAMVTLELVSDEAAYRKKSLSHSMAEILEKLRAGTANGRQTFGYERDLFVFHEKQVHIVRPNILLNWTRTAAINDAARIYGDIALALECR